MKDDCLFCKLANGVFPSNTLFEDEDFRVIFDIAPVSKGHALILPKKHFENIYEIDDETASKAFVLAKKMAKAMNKAFESDGFNVLQNNGEAGGQTIFHFHLHLIPRNEKDGAIKFGKQGSTTDEQFAKMLEMVKEQL